MEARRRTEPERRRDSLTFGQRWQHPVGRELDETRARFALDPLGLDQEAGAIGRPAFWLDGQPSLDLERSRQPGVPDVVRGKRRLAAAKRAQRDDTE